MVRHFYAEKNPYGVNLSYASIGWQVLRFKSKKERDDYVDENKWQGCNQVVAKCSAKTAMKIIGTKDKSRIIWDNEPDGYEIGRKYW